MYKYIFVYNYTLYFKNVKCNKVLIVKKIVPKQLLRYDLNLSLCDAIPAIDIESIIIPQSFDWGIRTVNYS